MTDSSVMTTVNNGAAVASTTNADKVFGAVAGTFDASGLAHFREYDAQLSIPEIADTRIVKCMYKAAEIGGKKSKENAYIRIPTSHISEESVIARITELAPFVVSYLASVEDRAIKEAHKIGQLNYHLGALTMDNLIESLEESETSGRLNKEMIETWFTDSIESELGLLFAAKLEIDIDTANELSLLKLQKILDAYKAKFASLASPKTGFKESDCLALIKVIEQADVNTSLIGKKFIIKLSNMKDKTDDVLLAL